MTSSPFGLLEDVEPELEGTVVDPSFELEEVSPFEFDDVSSFELDESFLLETEEADFSSLDLEDEELASELEAGASELELDSATADELIAGIGFGLSAGLDELLLPQATSNKAEKTKRILFFIKKSSLQGRL